MKNVPNAFLYSMFLIGFLFSCQRELGEIEGSEKSEILRVREWYENNFTMELPLKSLDLTKGKLIAKPYWEGGFYRKHKGFTTVEVPLSTFGKFGFSTIESKLAFKETGDDRFLQTMTRMVVLTNNRDEEIVGFLMTIIPDKDFRASNDFKAFSSSYLQWQKGFSGYILYHDMDGSFSIGWKLLNGQVTKVVLQKQNTEVIDVPENGSKSLLVEEGCHDYYLTTWYQTCTDWYTNDVYTNTTCYEYSLTEYMFTECQYNTEDDGSGGGNNVFLHPSQSDPYVPQPGDKFGKPFLPPTMPIQMPNTCVTAIMAYINNNVCGGTINEGVYILDYWSTYGENVVTTGVALNNVPNFINNHFHTTTFGGLTMAIDNGQVVMTDIVSELTNSAHNVLVVGYHPNGDIIYMDPEFGSFREAPATDFGANFAISIIGCYED